MLKRYKKAINSGHNRANSAQQLAMLKSSLSVGDEPPIPSVGESGYRGDAKEVRTALGDDEKIRPTGQGSYTSSSEWCKLISLLSKFNL